MKVWTTAAVTLAVVAAVGIGAAMSPVASGQSEKRDFDHARVLQVLSGGSYIGVSGRDVDAEDATRLKLSNVGGVLIEEVQEDSPAAKAGIRDGDVVVEFDGERVRSMRQFSRLVQETPSEREVQTVLVRDGQRMTVSVQPQSSGGARALLGRFGDLHVVPPTPPPAPAPPMRPAPAPFDMFSRLEPYFGRSTGRLGITVGTLSEQLADYFGTEDGVLVTSVYDNSAAAKAGLKAGDVITAIDGSAVDSPSDVSRRAERLEDGDEFTLEIVRDKKAMTLKGKVEKRQPRRWTSRTII
jgi:serine protease Do